MVFIDCFTYYNENKLLQFRLSYLKDYVDYFVICEATKTFSGKPKDLYFDSFKLEYPDLYEQVKHKIVHLIDKDMPEGDNPWVRENHQRNFLRKTKRIII
jgi:beta-1,4-mannosyl-glycoprotein beta-1,4-N-acetylglucosaminyltransferase